MDFRNKIASLTSKWWKTQWKEEIKKEKKQKYLFDSDPKNDWFHRSRNTSHFYKSKKWLLVFTGYFYKNLRPSHLVETYGFIMGLIGAMLILLTIYIVAFSSYFRISPNQVLVEAMTPGVDIGIAYRALEGIYGDSIFFIDEAGIAKKLQMQLKNLESVRIDRLYPNGIKILISGMPIVFETTITGIANKKWWLSKNWILIPENNMGESKPKYQLDITADDFVGDIFLSYKQVIPDVSMVHMLRIFEIFGSEWPDLKIVWSRYFAHENELHISLESGTRIILALQDDVSQWGWDAPKNIREQLLTLRTYIKNNPDRLTDKSLHYIDARIPGKIFVCSDPVICQKNLILIYGEAYK